MNYFSRNVLSCLLLPRETLELIILYNIKKCVCISFF